MLTIALIALAVFLSVVFVRAGRAELIDVRSRLDRLERSTAFSYLSSDEELLAKLIHNDQELMEP
jgi:hypothetical protein